MRLVEEIRNLSDRATRWTIIFTVVETVILTLWLDALGIGTDLLPTSNALAIGVLFVGLLVEHFIASATGRV